MGAREAIQVVERVGAIVEVERRVNLRDHAPHRLAQQRRAFHGAVAAHQRRVGRPAEIGRQHPTFLLGCELVVRSEIGEVEKRGVETGVVPIDEPQPRAVVDEVGGEKVVVREHHVDFADGAFERGGDVDQLRQTRRVRTVGVPQRMRVVAQHVENPERDDGSAHVIEKPLMNLLDERHDLAKACVAVEVGAAAGLALDEPDDDHARFGVHHLGRDAGERRGLGRFALVEAHDLVHGHVFAEAHDESLAAVRHHEVGVVGDAAGQPLRRDGALPDRQVDDALQRTGHVARQAVLTRRAVRRAARPAR